MARICDICKKHSDFGQNRPFCLKVTKRKRKPNTQQKTILLDGKMQRLCLCTRCIRTQTKKQTA